MGVALPLPVPVRSACHAPPADLAAAQRAKAWLRADSYTAAELVEIGVPGLPATKPGMSKLLERLKVSGFARRRNGGTTLIFPKVCLPREIRVALTSRLLELMRPLLDLPASAEPVAAADPHDGAVLTRSQQQLACATPRRAARADSRAFAVRAFEGWVAGTGMQGRRAADRFAEAWAGRRVEAPEWVREALPAVSAPSLLRWQARLRAEGAIALAGDYKPRVSTIGADTVLLDAAEGFVARHPHGTGAHLIAFLRARFRGEGRRLPSYRAACRWLEEWRRANRQLHAHLLSPDAHRGRFRPAFGSAAAGIERPNQLWEMDSTPGDILLREEVDGREVRTRHAVIGVVDVATRRKLLLVAPTSSAAGVALLLRRAILEWGVPETVRTDNGADYVSRQISRLLADLDVQRDITPPFTPEAKPFIERALGAFSHGLVELLPQFSGHSVAEAQAIRDQTSFAQRLMKRGEAAELPLSPAEFQDFCDRWCRDLYAHRPHSGLGGETPAGRAAAYAGPPLRRIADERALDALLEPIAGLRTVTKKGLRLDGGTYIAAALGCHVGAQVECRHDPADLGRVHVFTPEGEFLCVAEDPERTGVDRRAIAEAAKRLARRGVSERRAELRERAKAVPKGRALADLILDASAADAADRAAAVVAFPRRTEPHSTPALEQLGRAARADEYRPAPERTAEDAARAEWLARKAEKVARAAQAESGEAQLRARIARALALREALVAGRPVPPEERAWFEGYRGLGEFRTALRFRGIDPDEALPNTA